MCPCRIDYFWQNWGRWACVHAEYISFGITEGIGRVPMRIVSAGTQGKGGGGRGGDESDAMDAAPTAVWRRPAQPGPGGRIRCVRWNRLQALRHQTPNTPPPASEPTPWAGSGGAPPIRRSPRAKSPSRGDRAREQGPGVDPGPHCDGGPPRVLPGSPKRLARPPEWAWHSSR